jgi:hypothetical protein
VKNGIDALVVIGGDGSLTGADKLRSEWAGLLDELISTNRLEASECQDMRGLTIVGLVGSIDNDMAMTDVFLCFVIFPRLRLVLLPHFIAFASHWIRSLPLQSRILEPLLLK